MNVRIRGSGSRAIGLLLATLLVGLGFGCDSDSPTASSFPPGMGPDGPNAPGMGGIGTGAGTGPFTSTVAAAVDRAIQDEYQAEQIYARVLEDFGDVRPFANVVHAEERHSNSLARLYQDRRMPVPVSRFTLNNVPRFSSIAEACAAAVREEERNIAMYDELLRIELPADVETVMTNNRQASLENHLPGFRLCDGS